MPAILSLRKLYNKVLLVKRIICITTTLISQYITPTQTANQTHPPSLQQAILNHPHKHHKD